ncbi:MauE/DoxX family redox-associated membrane protein [Cumulibacter manganitolerans]|uniref:MauE/DoxX family redox-associated membrane protein n=1 Tax=Cumulibacter manganitolerans TaxID=1884992 RepID=UPI001E3554CA|nr:MauE/DoxX family redox-associated membrane protein [Cumulibacter manganitolerans]
MHPEPADDSGSWARLRPAVGTAIRLVMGVVFGYAGISKILDIPVAKVSVESYRIFPREIADTIGVVLPVVEIALGLLLLLGVGTRIVSIMLSLLLIAFIAGIASLWVRGISTQCGCFGGSLIPTGRPDYPLEIARDSGMLLATAWLVLWPRTRFAVEDLLGRQQDPAAARVDDLGAPAGDALAAR